MEDNFFSFSPRVRNGPTRQNEDIFEERQPEPVQVEPRYQVPGPSEPNPVNGNVIRPKSVAELTDMVLAMSTKKASLARRPSAGPSKQPQGDGGHVKPVVDETTVAFGRTTKLKDTIQGVKPVAHGPVRPLVGTAKEVEFLKKTVESLQSEIGDDKAEIAALKATCENHRSEYVELLNTVDSMMLRMSAMEKKMASIITSSGSDAKNTAFNDAPSTSKPRKAIMDSVALVKGNNYEEVRIKHRETDRTWDDPDRHRENAKTPPPIAATQRARELQSDRRKRKDNLNRTIEGRPDERLNQTTRDDRYQDQENRYRGHKNAYHDEYERESDSQPISGRYKEKVTYRREYMYSPGRNADRPVLSTTIESTLTRDGPHRPRQQNNLKCPQIEEPSDSEDETGYSDDYQGYGGGGHNAVSGIYKAPPAAPQRRYNDDGHGDIQYTVMPDVFEDELDSEEEPAPVPKEQHRVRQKVADRLARNGRS